MGPNGSGKSNVIDAMLFVFGKRAKQVKACSNTHCMSETSCCLSFLDELPNSPSVHISLQLRLNKVSELIHNSTHHKNLAMARVIVHFEEILDTVSPSADASQLLHATLWTEWR